MSDSDTDIVEVNATASSPMVPGDLSQAMEQAQKNIQAIHQYVKENFKEGVDFGSPFPGSDRPSLLKPGAEKFNLLFNARPQYEVVRRVEDRDSGYCFYHIKCFLVNKANGAIIGEGDGSSNAYEGKYRWRNAERVCPSCKTSAIIKGRKEYGSGWLCWSKKGGCGTKFQDNDSQIVDQAAGRIENPDLADVWNTVLKIASKRAHVAATLSTGGVSGLFTQDGEDSGPGLTGDYEGVSDQGKAPQGTAPQQQAPRQTAPPSPPDPSPTDRTGTATAGEPEKEVEMVVFPAGATFPADGDVSASWAKAFKDRYVGNSRDSIDKTGKWHPAHRTRHLKKHFDKATVLDLTNEEFNAFLRHTRRRRGEKEHIEVLPPYTETESAVTEVEDGESATDAVFSDWHQLFYEKPYVSKVPVKLSEVIRKAWRTNKDDLTEEQLGIIRLAMGGVESGDILPELDAIVAEITA